MRLQSFAGWLAQSGIPLAETYHAPVQSEYCLASDYAPLTLGRRGRDGRDYRATPLLRPGTGQTGASAHHGNDRHPRRGPAL